MTETEVNSKLEKLDANIGGIRESVLAILKQIHEEFPLDKVMSPDFKGTHSLTIDTEGRLCANIWYDDKHHAISFYE